jgi:membrane protein implicated in regulation of membrane protease activity
MDLSLAWAIAGLVLVIVELLTGTFYLLMLALAAFGAAAAAWLGFEFPIQALVAAAVAGVGCWGVHLYRARDRGAKMAPIDAGMPASFETWIDSGSRLARVR